MRTLALIATAALLAACDTYTDTPVPYSPERFENEYIFTPESLKQPMTVKEQKALTQLLGGIPVAAAKVATLEANDPALLASPKANSVKSLLEKAGYRADTAVVPNEVGMPWMRLRVHFKPYPYAEHCPNWRDPGIFNQEDSLTSHLGCANLINLSQMVADPNDLVKGQSDPHADTESAVRAVERHYSGEVQAEAQAEEQTSTTGESQ